MSSKYAPPDSSAADKAEAAGRELLGLVPKLGTGLKALVDLAFPSLLSKRRDAWMQRVGAAVEKLEREQRTDLQRLSSDEGFLDLLIHATAAAMRTRHEEKRQALSSTIVHAATAIDPDRDEELMFVRYIDDLTPSHLQFLRFLATNEADIAEAQSYQALLEPYVLALVKRHMRPVSPEFFRVMCEDLVTRGLLRISRNVDDFPGLAGNDVIVTGEKDGPNVTATVLVTGIGHRFVRYIEDRNPPGVNSSGHG